LRFLVVQAKYLYFAKLLAPLVWRFFRLALIALKKNF